MRRRTWRASAAVALVVAVGACGGTDDEGQPVIDSSGAGVIENPDAPAGDEVEPVAGMPDPCALVTAADVDEVLGVATTDEQRQQVSPTSASCAFLLEDGSPVVTTTVRVQDGATELEAVRALDDAEAIDGLGDEAVWSETVGLVAALDGDDLVSASVLVVDQDAGEVREQAAALVALGLQRL